MKKLNSILFFMASESNTLVDSYSIHACCTVYLSHETKPCGQLIIFKSYETRLSSHERVVTYIWPLLYIPVSGTIKCLISNCYMYAHNSLSHLILQFNHVCISDSHQFVLTGRISCSCCGTVMNLVFPKTITWTSYLVLGTSCMQSR